METNFQNPVHLSTLSKCFPNKIQKHFQNFWLVGSRARGDFRIQSDVDILIQANIPAEKIAKKLRPSLPIGDRVDTLATYVKSDRTMVKCEHSNRFHFVIISPGEEILFPERIILN